MAVILSDEFNGAAGTSLNGRAANVGDWLTQLAGVSLELRGDGSAGAIPFDTFGVGCANSVDIPEGAGTVAVTTQVVGTTVGLAEDTLIAYIGIERLDGSTASIIDLFAGNSSFTDRLLALEDNRPDGYIEHQYQTSMPPPFPWSVRLELQVGAEGFSSAKVYLNNVVVVDTPIGGDFTGPLRASLYQDNFQPTTPTFGSFLVETDGAPPDPPDPPEPTAGLHIRDEFQGAAETALAGTVPSGTTSAWVAPPDVFVFNGLGGVEVRANV